ncbi:hypothetical protein PVAP13_1NG249314 [Panicum virgatum]|uniref:Uncharacterized protein n=1 Tax=Panicum virgatum TaxID=38727 RepID=A0A8T0WUX3_PANVG|nr:hypothetical protein PVAP13_1NG249314 [Panicum virgatum]
MPRPAAHAISSARAHPNYFRLPPALHREALLLCCQKLATGEATSAPHAVKPSPGPAASTLNTQYRRLDRRRRPRPRSPEREAAHAQPTSALAAAASRSPEREAARAGPPPTSRISLSSTSRCRQSPAFHIPGELLINKTSFAQRASAAAAEKGASRLPRLRVGGRGRGGERNGAGPRRPRRRRGRGIADRGGERAWSRPPLQGPACRGPALPRPASRRLPAALLQLGRAPASAPPRTAEGERNRPGGGAPHLRACVRVATRALGRGMAGWLPPASRSVSLWARESAGVRGRRAACDVEIRRPRSCRQAS